MGAVEVKKYFAMCDNCEEILEKNNTVVYCCEEGEAQESAHKAGWEISKDMKLYCPDCVKEVRKDGTILLNPPRQVYIKVTPRPPLKGELFQKGEKALYNGIEVEVLTQDELRLRTEIKIPHQYRRGFNKADVFTTSLTKIK